MILKSWKCFEISGDGCTVLWIHENYWIVNVKWVTFFFFNGWLLHVKYLSKKWFLGVVLSFRYIAYWGIILWERNIGKHSLCIDNKKRSFISLGLIFGSFCERAFYGESGSNLCMCSLAYSLSSSFPASITWVVFLCHALPPWGFLEPAEHRLNL